MTKKRDYPSLPIASTTKKPGPDIDPAKYARIRAEALAGAADPALATQLGRMSLHGELTNRQTVAGLRVAQIYHTYHRFKRLRETPKSPSYETGFSGNADVDEERLAPEQLERLEAEIRKAEADFLWLQGELPIYPREVHAALIDLCVYDQPPNSRLYPDIRRQLGFLSHRFDYRAQREGKGQRGGVRPMREKVAETAAILPLTLERIIPADPLLKGLQHLVAVLRPDLGAAGARQAAELVGAFVARERFERAKGAKRLPYRQSGVDAAAIVGVRPVLQCGPLRLPDSQQTKIPGPGASETPGQSPPTQPRS